MLKNDTLNKRKLAIKWGKNLQKKGAADYNNL